MSLNSKAAANRKAAMGTCLLEEFELSPISSLVPSVQFVSGQTGTRLSSCLPSAAIPHTLSAGIAVSPPEWSDNNMNSASSRKISMMSWNWQKRQCVGIGDHRPLMRSVPDFPERPGRWVRLSTWQSYETSKPSNSQT